MSEAKTPMTAEEVRSRIEDLARGGEGADQRWALRMLSAQETSTIMLPEPMNDAQYIESLSILMRGGGNEITQHAYKKAFPNAQRGIHLAPVLSLDQLPEMVLQEAMKIVSLPLLYKRFPHLKRSGQPPGYPKKSLSKQQDWCQRVAANELMNELNEPPRAD